MHPHVHIHRRATGWRSPWVGMLAIATMVAALLPASAAPAEANDTLTVSATEDVGLGGDVGGDTVACPAGADQVCTLRGAVEAANADGDITTIDLPAGIYELVIEDDGNAATDPAATGSLGVTSSDLTIVGEGSDVTLIDGGGSGAFGDSLFSIEEDAGLVLAQLALTDSYTNDPGAAARVLAGGELTLEQTVISNNSSSFNGAALRAVDGTIAISNSSVIDNESRSNTGGAVRVEGSSGHLAVSASTFSGNYAAQGGGAVSVATGASGTIASSTFVENVARRGGALHVVNSGSELVVENSTLSGNHTRPKADGGSTPHGAAATAGTSGRLILRSSTVSGNEADRSGEPIDGGDGLSVAYQGEIVLSNTIVADNGVENCSDDVPGTATGTLTSEDHNLDSDGSCGLDQGNDIPEGDADLGPLAENGGLTATHALGPNSEAIDAGDSALATDQRGVVRPQGSGVDIGSYELIPSANADGCDFSWTGNANTSDWFDPDNWDSPPGVPATSLPGPEDVVCVDVEEELPINFDGPDTTIAELRNTTDVDADTAVRFASGELTITDASVLEYLGIRLHNAPATLVVEDSLITGGVSRLQSATLTGPGTTTLGGIVNVDGGGGGPAVIAGHDLVLAGDSTMHDSVAVYGTFELRDGSTVTNTGSLEMRSEATFLQPAGQSGNVFRNEGTLIKPEMWTGTSRVTANFENGPTGDVTLEQPLVMESSGSNAGSMTLIGTSAQTMRFNLDQQGETFRFEPGSELNVNWAAVWVQGGDLVFATEDISMPFFTSLSTQVTGRLIVDADVTVDRLSAGGGGIAGSGDLTVTGTAFWGGGTYSDDAQLVFGTDTRLVGGQVTRTVEPGRTVIIDGDLADRDHGSVASNGWFEIAEGGVVEVVGDYDHRGDELTVHGTLDVGSHTVAEDGVVRGTGTIIGSVTNAALVAPGASPGILSIDGEYTQEEDGQLDIQLEGTHEDEYDRLAVTGEVSLDGTLDVELLDGFIPQDGDMFRIITASAVDGEFADVDLPALDGDDPLELVYLDDEVWLIVGDVEFPVDDPVDEEPDQEPVEEPTEEPGEEVPTEGPVEEVTQEETTEESDEELADTGASTGGLFVGGLLALLLGVALTLSRRRTGGEVRVQ